MSDSLGLVDFAIRLVIFFLNLPNGQVLFWGKFKLQKYCNQSCWLKRVWGLVEMTCGLVHASYSLPEWQPIKLTFFAPCCCQDKWYWWQNNLILYSIWVVCLLKVVKMKSRIFLYCILINLYTPGEVCLINHPDVCVSWPLLPVSQHDLVQLDVGRIPKDLQKRW